MGEGEGSREKASHERRKSLIWKSKGDDGIEGTCEDGRVVGVECSHNALCSSMISSKIKNKYINIKNTPSRYFQKLPNSYYHIQKEV